MAGYLLDTNQLSEALNPVSRVRDRIQQVCGTGGRIGTCVPVLCELEAGIQQTTDPVRCRRTLRTIMDRVRLWPLEQKLAEQYGEVYLEMRRLGRVLSHVDMILVAMARLQRLTLLTADRDFEAVPGLRTENWLADPAA